MRRLVLPRVVVSLVAVGTVGRGSVALTLPAAPPRGSPVSNPFPAGKPHAATPDLPVAATNAALATEVADLAADVVALGATVAAQQDQLAQLAATATQAARASVIDPATAADFTITVDADGLLNDTAAARQEAIDQLRTDLATYPGCRVGVVQTFGASPQIAEGIALATRVNVILQEQFPAVVAQAVLSAFATVDQSRGLVEIQLYFYRGCRPA